MKGIVKLDCATDKNGKTVFIKDCERFRDYELRAIREGLPKRKKEEFAFFCPLCGKEVEGVKGPKYTHHYRHKPDEINGTVTEHSTESVIHANLVLLLEIIINHLIAHGKTLHYFMRSGSRKSRVYNSLNDINNIILSTRKSTTKDFVYDFLDGIDLAKYEKLQKKNENRIKPDVSLYKKGSYVKSLEVVYKHEDTLKKRELCENWNIDIVYVQIDSYEDYNRIKADWEAYLDGSSDYFALEVSLTINNPLVAKLIDILNEADVHGLVMQTEKHVREHSQLLVDYHKLVISIQDEIEDEKNRQERALIEQKRRKEERERLELETQERNHRLVQEYTKRKDKERIEQDVVFQKAAHKQWLAQQKAIYEKTGTIEQKPDRVYAAAYEKGIITQEDYEWCWYNDSYINDYKHRRNKRIARTLTVGARDVNDPHLIEIYRRRLRTNYKIEKYLADYIFDDDDTDDLN